MANYLALYEGVGRQIPALAQSVRGHYQDQADRKTMEGQRLRERDNAAFQNTMNQVQQEAINADMAIPDYLRQNDDAYERVKSVSGPLTADMLGLNNRELVDFREGVTPVDLDDGSIALHVRRKDGGDGILTQRGSDDPDDPAQVFTRDQFIDDVLTPGMVAKGVNPNPTEQWRMMTSSQEPTTEEYFDGVSRLTGVDRDTVDRTRKLFDVQGNVGGAYGQSRREADTGEPEPPRAPQASAGDQQPADPLREAPVDAERPVAEGQGPLPPMAFDPTAYDSADPGHPVNSNIDLPAIGARAANVGYGALTPGEQAAVRDAAEYKEANGVTRFSWSDYPPAEILRPGTQQLLMSELDGQPPQSPQTVDGYTFAEPVDWRAQTGVSQRAAEPARAERSMTDWASQGRGAAPSQGEDPTLVQRGGQAVADAMTNPDAGRAGPQTPPDSLRRPEGIDYSRSTQVPEAAEDGEVDLLDRKVSEGFMAAYADTSKLDEPGKTDGVPNAQIKRSPHVVVRSPKYSLAQKAAATALYFRRNGQTMPVSLMTAFQKQGQGPGAPSIDDLSKRVKLEKSLVDLEQARQDLLNSKNPDNSEARATNAKHVRRAVGNWASMMGGSDEDTTTGRAETYFSEAMTNNRNFLQSTLGVPYTDNGFIDEERISPEQLHALLEATELSVRLDGKGGDDGTFGFGAEPAIDLRGVLDFSKLPVQSGEHKEVTDALQWASMNNQDLYFQILNDYGAGEQDMFRVLDQAFSDIGSDSMKPSLRRAIEASR